MTTPVVLFAALEIAINWPAGLFGPSNGWAVDYYPLGVALLGFSCFLLGVIVGSAVIGLDTHRPLAARAQEVLVADRGSYLLGSVLLALTLIALGLVMYGGMPPIVESISAILRGGNAFEAALALTEERRLLTKSHYFGGEYRGQGAIRIVLRVGWPFLVGVALCMWVGTRKRVWAIFAAIWFVFLFVFVAGEGTRAPFLFSLVFLVVLLSLLTRIGYRHVIAGISLFTVALLAMSLLSSKLQWALDQENATSIMTEQLAQRIAYGNGANTVTMIELVRNGDWGLRLGEVHLQRMLNAIPGVEAGRPLSYELYRTLNPMGTSTTYASATYLGDAYVDFGLPGVAAIYFGVGIALCILQSTLMRMKRTVLNLCIVAHLTFAAGFIPLTGPAGFISTLPVLGFVYALLYLGLRIRGPTAHVQEPSWARVT